MSKISTGFLLTPPSKSRKRNSLPKSTKNGDSEMDALFENLMSCPIKKQLVLKLLNSQRTNIEEYKRKEREKNQSPVNKIKQKQQCESPTALMRRRALEQLNRGGSPSSSEHNLENRPESRASNSSSEATSASSSVPFNEIMKGVIAYIEIQREGQDKSSGVKAVMRAMGATVRESFTKDVTHVVFKDGSYTTYQKAQLKRVYLVSVLWVDFSRKNGLKENEKLYPAMGAYNNNVSSICSQMYKEYEDIIKEEYHRSIVEGTPLPTTKSLIERRRTLTTPSVSSFNSYRLSQELRSSQDREVDNIMNRKTITSTPLSVVSESVEITDDESDNIPIINGTIFDKSRDRIVMKSLENIIESSSMDLTQIGGSKSLIPPEKNKRKSCVEFTTTKNKNTRKSVANKSNSDKTKSTLDSDRTRLTISETKLDSDKSRSLMSDLRLSSDKNKTTSISDKSKSIMSDLKLTSDTTKNTVSDKTRSSMSPLKISSISDMSSLRVSSNVEILSGNICKVIQKPPDNAESSKNTASFESREEEMIDQENIVKAIKSIESPINKYQNVTIRKKIVNESKSDDSEIISPDKNLLKRKSVVSKARGVTPLKKTKKSEKEDNKKDLVTPRKSLRVRVSTTPYTPSTTVRNRKKKPGLTARKSLVKEMTKNSQEVSNKHTDSSSDDSAKKNKKLRKLYDPDESVLESVSDEKEREEKRKRVEEEKNNKGVFVNPSSVNLNLLLSNKKKQSLLKDDNILIEEPKKPPKKKKTTKKKPSFNSSTDRQDELLNEIMNSKKKSQKDESIIPITPIIRRSTLEFQNATQQKGSIKKFKQEKPKQPTIVCTKLHQDDVVTFCQIVKKLGGFTVEDEVSNKTTHVVAGEPKRTINMLRAITRGCWILRHEWLFKSLEEGRWLPEEDFEVTDFAPIVQQSRIRRQAFGPKYTLDVFENCAPIYVARGSNPRCSDLRELITLCKGKIVLDPAMAKIVVGEYFPGDDDVTCVKETWVLDCITQNKVRPFRKYLQGSPERNKRKSVVV